MRLSELHTGERGVIVKVFGHGGFRKRIVEMGFIKGKTVRVILNAPLRDPIEYEVMGYKISLRRSEAALIEVIGEEEALAKAQQEATENRMPLHPTAEEEAELQQRLLHKMEKMADEKRRTIYVALLGNPNCGKTSLFNIASGAHEHVGNYSGVTVGAKDGFFDFTAKNGNTYHFRIVDLPGTYSLSTYSPEELYVRKQLIEETPDVIVNVIDASNLERNLYLTTQLIDMHLPLVCALNMYDELEARGDQLDHHTLGILLGTPMIPTVCRTGRGVEELFEKVIAVYEGNNPKISRHIHINHGAELESSIDKIKAAFQRNDRIRYKYSTRYLAIKCLEGDKEVDSLIDKLPNHDEIISIRYAEQQRLQKELGESAESALIDAKYGFIQGALRETFRPAKRSEEPTLTDRIDRIVTHRIWGFPIFFALLFLMFEATFTLGQYPMDWLQWLVDRIGEFVSGNMAPGALRDLLVDGIIGGVGAVIVFLPNILILYTFISLLEDSGYMARAAFIMDRLMHHMGLHGKSFIPMIMGFGCNVPAVIATRTIENPKSRLITMLVIPMMSCSARIPIYILLIGTFFPHHAAFVLLGLYALGIFMAVLMAKLFSKVLLKGVDLPFVMELPPYRLPAAKSIGRHTWEKGRQYLRKMGHIILVASIIIWFLGYFPRPAETPTPSPQPTASTQQTAQPSAEVAAPQMSYLEQAGRLIGPIMSPLGFDWRMNVGILSGVSAKELVVSTMGVMYAGEKIDDADAAGHDTHLQSAIARSLSPASALSYLVFILLYFPCIATVTAIKNETGHWKWAIFTVCYTTGLAYAVSFIVYRLALLFL